MDVSMPNSDATAREPTSNKDHASGSPGWYPTPDVKGGLRWWNGDVWTDRVVVPRRKRRRVLPWVVGALVVGVALDVSLVIGLGLFRSSEPQRPAEPVRRCLAIGNDYSDKFWNGSARQTLKAEYTNAGCETVCGSIIDFTQRHEDTCPNGAASLTTEE